MKALVLLALAAAVVALALVPGPGRSHDPTALAEPAPRKRALRLEDMERLRRERRALIDAAHAGPIAPVGHRPAD